MVKVNDKDKNNKDKNNNNPSNSLVFGRWLQTKIFLSLMSACLENFVLGFLRIKKNHKNAEWDLIEMRLIQNAISHPCNFNKEKNLCPKDFRKCSLKNSLFVVPKQIKTGKFSLLQRWIPPEAKHHNFVLIMRGCDDVLVDSRVGLWPRKPWFDSRNHQTFFRRTWCLKMCLVSAHSNKDEKKTLPNAMNRFDSAQWRLTLQYH